jgi:thioester reductase-like protein
MSSGETIFVTGFPGFIAGRLVKQMASGGAAFILLVQASFLDRAQREVMRIAGEANVDPARFRIVQGDIALTNLALSGEDLGTTRNEATNVFHLAAAYDLAVPRELGMQVNFEGTRNVNDFVRSIRHLRRYNYVSTCYVSGLRTSEILETELRHTAGFHNYYEETKYLAEVEVDQLKPELPVTIYRPSVVCGDSKTGETVKFDGVYYLIDYIKKFSGLMSLFNIGSHDSTLNLVPVDFVVEAMTAIARDERGVGATVQLADPNPPSTYGLFEASARALSERGSLVRIPKGLVRAGLSLPFHPKLTGLPHSAVPYFFTNQSYDTSVASELLQPYGIHCPSFTDYAKTLVSFVEARGKVSTPPQF